MSRNTSEGVLCDDLDNSRGGGGGGGNCKEVHAFRGQYSQLSLNGHLYKTDTSIRQTPGVGPVPVSFQLFLQ